VRARVEPGWPESGVAHLPAEELPSPCCDLDRGGLISLLGQSLTHPPCAIHARVRFAVLGRFEWPTRPAGGPWSAGVGHAWTLEGRLDLRSRGSAWRCARRHGAARTLAEMADCLQVSRERGAAVASQG